jgi:hypothetical protein
MRQANRRIGVIRRFERVSFLYRVLRNPPSSGFVDIRSGRQKEARIVGESAQTCNRATRYNYGAASAPLNVIQ